MIEPNPPVMVSATELSNTFLGSLTEICFVTRDHRRTMRGLVQLGIGPWRVYTFDSTTLTDQTYHQKPDDYAIKVCFATVGALAVEIMEPLHGPSIFQQHLDRHGEGIQHLAFDCQERPWAERHTQFAEHGFAPVQSGTFAGRNRSPCSTLTLLSAPPSRPTTSPTTLSGPNPTSGIQQPRRRNSQPTQSRLSRNALMNVGRRAKRCLMSATYASKASWSAPGSFRISRSSAATCR